MTEELNPKLEPQPALGRVREPDPRDANFRLANPRAAAAPVTHKYWLSLGKAFDQGDSSECVSYSTQRFLVTHPVVNKPLPFREFYLECQDNDQWPGREPEYYGTSVRAAMKRLKARGLISEYRWAFNAETVVNHVLTKGPVIMGTDWHWDMFDCDRWGYIRPTGSVEGGHAWCVIGANRNRVDPLTGERGAVRMINSWGPNWAQRGRAWVTFKDLDKLIRAYGEAAVAIEVKKAA